MDKLDFYTLIGSGVTTGSGAGAFTTTDKALSIILMVVGILSAIITLIISLINLYEKAKKQDSDGGENITENEIKEGVDMVKDTVDEIVDIVKGDKKDDKNR